MPQAYSGPGTDLIPDAAAIVAFCTWWFEFCNRGVIEIGWTDGDGRGLVHFEQFERGDVSALAVCAVQANLVPGQSVYVRAATVRPWNGAGHRTSDSDFLQAPGVWGDMDKAEDVEHAREVAAGSFVKPNGSVITGTVPHVRLQSWVRVAEPIVSGELIRSLNVRYHRLYGGDASVVNPSRLMRLPGTIAWPWKPGRVAELTQFVLPDAAAGRLSAYPVSSLVGQLPVLPNGAGAPFETIIPLVAHPGGLTTVSSHILAIRAGREWHNHMVRLVAHWVGQGRSTVEIMGHCADWTLPGWSVEDTRREVSVAIEGARKKWGRGDVDPVIVPGVGAGADGGSNVLGRILTMQELELLPPPQWMIHGILPDRGMIVPFGPPKSGKTFIVLSALLHVAAGVPWFGRPVRQGAIVYIAGEGVGGLRYRLAAMRISYGIDINVPLFIIPKAVNFRNHAEVVALAALIRETVGEQTIAAVVPDTLARAMPGADENSAQEVGAVIAEMDWLREELGCATLSVHHSGKDEGRGARGTSALRGAWDCALEIRPAGKGRTLMTVADQKEAESGETMLFRMDEVAVTLSRTSLVPVLVDGGKEDATSGSDDGRPRKPPEGQAGIAFQVLSDLLASPESAILPPGPGMPDGTVRGVPFEVWREGFYDKIPGLESGAKRQAFHRAQQVLLLRRLINIKGDWVWSGLKEQA